MSNLAMDNMASNMTIAVAGVLKMRQLALQDDVKTNTSFALLLLVTLGVALISPLAPGFAPGASIPDGYIMNTKISEGYCLQKLLDFLFWKFGWGTEHINEHINMLATLTESTQIS